MADEEGATPSDEPPAAAKASVPPKVLRAHFEDRFDRVIEEALRNALALAVFVVGAQLTVEHWDEIYATYSLVVLGRFN